MSSNECTLDFAKYSWGEAHYPIPGYLGGPGKSPVTFCFISRMTTHWHRLATLDDDNLLQKAYNEILTIPDEVSDWKNTMKYILKLLGLERLFDCPSAISTTQVKRKVKDKL